MPEELVVVVASEQIDVLAPPAEIRVSVGVGARGQRGSVFYAGSLTPSAFFESLGETPLINDIFLSVVTRKMYQFVSTPAGNIWTELFDLTPLGGSGGGGTDSISLIPDPTYAGLYVESSSVSGFSQDPENAGLFLLTV